MIDLKILSSYQKQCPLEEQKITDNKLKVDLRLNTVKGDKNIMLQTLDLIDEISQK